MENKDGIVRKSALTVESPLHAVLFVHPRYWPDGAALESAMDRIEAAAIRFPESVPVVTKRITSEGDLRAFSDDGPAGAAMFIPMSGNVQAWMREAAGLFDTVGFFPGYDPAMLPPSLADELLRRNAAPALLEMYAVLRNEKQKVFIISGLDDMLAPWRAARAVFRLRQTRILQIGEMEPWVLSSEWRPDVIKERTGVTVVQVQLAELYDLYRRVDDGTITERVRICIENADGLTEPSETDVAASLRLQEALSRLMVKYAADGIALACFTLLHELGTTGCLALSIMNDDSRFVGACEGDLDSAVTLALLKAVTGKPAFMGNPILTQGSKLSLVHCSSPLSPDGELLPYRLRSHHESGIGVSPEVRLTPDKAVTLCRVSVRERTMTLCTGITAEMPPRPTCRTRISIELDDTDAFMEHLTGLHQTLVFGQYLNELEICADLLGVHCIRS